MAISISEPAADRVKAYLESRGKGVGVRLAVKTSGCSGMAYVMEFVDDINELEDEIFQDHGVTIVVDKKSLVYLDGTEMDYTKEGLNEGFKFINPNEKDSCGCGESFTV
ncbi:MAG: iron-sulfur cluster assembly protein IscA [Gammaproteobacteria bacterium]